MVQWFALYLENHSVAEHHALSQYDLTSNLKMFIGHCDLYFMIQWFCLTSWRLFDVWTLYFVTMSQCNAAFALKQCSSQWSIFHGLMILPYILNGIWWITTIARVNFQGSLLTSSYPTVKEKSISPCFFLGNFQTYFRFHLPGVIFQVVYSTNKQAYFQWRSHWLITKGDSPALSGFTKTTHNYLNW